MEGEVEAEDMGAEGMTVSTGDVTSNVVKVFCSSLMTYHLTINSFSSTPSGIQQHRLGRG